MLDLLLTPLSAMRNSPPKLLLTLTFSMGKRVQKLLIYIFIRVSRDVVVPPLIDVYLSQASCVIVSRPVYSSAGLRYISP